MKHATLHSLAGLACLLAVSMASAAPDSGSTASIGPIAFDHGIPVFELPTLAVTPTYEQSKPARIARDGKTAPPGTPADDNRPRQRGTASGTPDMACYTPMRVVVR
ncbi:hypothetical protein [Salinisphaera hydrothermalis]|uniref:hypothetical protein n=1 Tax=Salinisphaera hydrothermalis TaxID=563188 RepID=UPI0033416175